MAIVLPQGGRARRRRISGLAATASLCRLALAVGFTWWVGGCAGGHDSSGAGGAAGNGLGGAPGSGGSGDAGTVSDGAGSGGRGVGGAGSPGTGGRADGGVAGTGGRGAGGSGGATGSDAGTGPNAPWDWVGVVGTGQSLAVGQFGTPAASTTQPYNNQQLTTRSLAWPVDPNNATLALVPLVEPIGRLSTAYPSSWPTNIAGETPHASMANQVTALVRAGLGGDYLGVHGEFGENGQCMTFLKKNATQSGVNGRAFEATLIETRAITRLARAAGKTYGIGAITVTHGECDAGNANYETDLYQLWIDYNADLSTITGQTQKIQMIVSQQQSTSDRSASTLAQWRIGVDHPSDVVLAGPKYQYPYAADHVHLITDGYRQLGEKYGQVYFERVVQGHAWQPLQPTTVERAARVITVHFHIPVPPLAFDSTFSTPHAAIAEWSAGRGFEVRGGAGRIAISSVAISGDAAQITCATDLPASGVFVGYALTGDAAAMAAPFAGTIRWGQLRDSDPFIGAITRRPQPNYAVAFELPVP
jgi:hypothetical protein